MVIKLKLPKRLTFLISILTIGSAITVGEFDEHILQPYLKNQKDSSGSIEDNYNAPNFYPPLDRDSKYLEPPEKNWEKLQRLGLMEV